MKEPQINKVMSGKERGKERQISKVINNMLKAK